MSNNRNFLRLIYLVAPAYLKTCQQIFDLCFERVRGMFVFMTLDQFKKLITGVQECVVKIIQRRIGSNK